MQIRKSIVLSAAAFLLAGAAHAQTAKDLVGTWQLVSSVNTAKDGTKIDTYGPNPLGMLIFDSNGQYALVFGRSDFKKFASDNRMQGTADENKEIVQGSIAHFGTYSVANKVITQHVEGGTWPSWIGTDQKREITAYSKNQFSYTLSASIGGTNVTTFKRIN